MCDCIVFGDCICTIFSFYPLSLSLQRDDDTALILASYFGHAEAIKALLTAPDIDVNHAANILQVRLFLLLT